MSEKELQKWYRRLTNEEEFHNTRQLGTTKLAKKPPTYRDISEDRNSYPDPTTNSPTRQGGFVNENLIILANKVSKKFPYPVEFEKEMESEAQVDLSSLAKGIPLNPLPAYPKRCSTVAHAPTRIQHLSASERKLAIQNALRYFPSSVHSELVGEFASELDTYGHIYMYRFRPVEYEMKAYPIHLYPAKCEAGRAIQHMIMNNLDPRVAQFPHELITYGGNGAVLSNWAQYHLVMYYLSILTEEQTLAMYSGHPLVITNGMMVPNYSTKEQLDKLYALGVTMYGQMTAGSYCYIGPQGIVHGTTLTMLNAGRKYLNSSDLTGKVLVTSGLGGMSGAQAKAGVISRSITVVAEVSRAALNKRHSQGWVTTVAETLDSCIDLIRQCRVDKKPISIGFYGNIVDLWERLVEEHKKSVENGTPELLVELGSDQTSLHNPFNGGYYPADLTFDESNVMMLTTARKEVQNSLKRQVAAINYLASQGMKFWDYGNSFLLEASRARADIIDPKTGKFLYPSYVEDIMGDIFSLGFGPFRWVCTSADPKDLALTDKVAGDVVERLAKDAKEQNKQQYEDNLLWIRQANDHKLVVGSQARILYSDALGRATIAKEFNALVKEGKLKAPVVISRDHHDVSGTDSPYRETANITDGSMFTADMAVQNFCGLGMRGATWVALHNGGGTGWGEAINGGFGFVLDGRDSTAQKIDELLFWDVLNGITRRAWAGNDNASWASEEAHKREARYIPTTPNFVSAELLENI